MPNYNRIHVFKYIEGVYYLSQLLFILDEGFKFQSSVCNGWHDVLVVSIDSSSITVLNIDVLDRWN